MSQIKDIALAPSGEMKIDWVERNMPVLHGIGEDFKKTQPFAGLKIALSVHLEAKTAYLCRVLEMGGAEMYVTGSNPLSTQDDVAAALANGGMEVFASYGCTMEEYEDCLCRVLEVGPNIIIDDGGDLVHLMHTQYTGLIPGVIGGYSSERVVHAAREGIFHELRAIGDVVEPGDVIAEIEAFDGTRTPVTTCIGGILRGLLRDGYPVTMGFKVADVDPRREELENCFLISDKARCIAGSVLELVAARLWE